MLSGSLGEDKHLSLIYKQEDPHSCIVASYKITPSNSNAENILAKTMTDALTLALFFSKQQLAQMCSLNLSALERGSKKKKINRKHEKLLKRYSQIYLSASARGAKREDSAHAPVKQVVPAATLRKNKSSFFKWITPVLVESINVKVILLLKNKAF